MSHNHYKQKPFIAWQLNSIVFIYSIRDMSIIRAYSSKLYEQTINILPAAQRRELFLNCANVAKIQGNIAIKKMIASAKENK